MVTISNQLARSAMMTILMFLTSCSSTAWQASTRPMELATPISHEQVLATPLVHNELLPTDTVPPTLTPIVETLPIQQQPTKSAPINIFGAALQTITDADGLELMVEAGSAWTRRDYPWYAVEPEEGLRQWENVASLDAELIAAAEKNMQVVLILGGTPGWAMDPNHPQCGGRVRQDKFTALANFSRDLVARYSQSPFNIQYFELWNEPEVYSFLGCWGEPSDPLGYYGGYYYGEMLKVIYPEMKSANPDAQVLIGGLLLGCNPELNRLNADGSPQDCSMTKFFEGILASTAGTVFDGVSFHAYDYYGGGLGKYGNANFAANWDTTGPSTLMKSKFLRDKMTRYGVTNKFLMNTEVALLCTGQICQTAEFEATKSYYLVEAYTAALADGYVANIWYSVYGDRNSGLISNNLEPRPAYNSFKFIQSILNGGLFSSQLNIAEGIKAYEFTFSDKSVVILWSIDEQNHQVTLSGVPNNIYRIDMNGSAIQEPALQELSVGRAPVIVVLLSNP